MGGRIIAIGDIHGHAQALAALLRQIQLRPDDTLVTLGDYVDRGPDSEGVLHQLIEIEPRCRLVPLMGNHDQMMLKARRSRDDFKFWVRFGGNSSLDSYGSLNRVPDEHWAFLQRLSRFSVIDGHFFVHANYASNQRLADQSSQSLLWLDLTDSPCPHDSGRIAVVGHTRQKGGRILDSGYLKCIDTGCGHGGLLSALDVTSGKTWQVTEDGTPV
jgi:serine/threonine protein phosphatase 1